MGSLYRSSLNNASANYTEIHEEPINNHFFLSKTPIWSEAAFGIGKSPLWWSETSPAGRVRRAEASLKG